VLCELPCGLCGQNLLTAEDKENRADRKENRHFNSSGYQITKLLNFPSFLSIEVHEQIGRLVDPHAMELRSFQLEREALPDRDGDVFCGRDLCCEFRDFFVEEAVVHCVEHFAVHSFFELLEINYKTGAWVHIPLHRHFEHVVVPMAVWIIAFAEDAPVLLRSEIRVVVVVRRGEFSFAGEIEQGDVLFLCHE
jgi:hypothetical protein